MPLAPDEKVILSVIGAAIVAAAAIIGLAAWAGLAISAIFG